MNQFFHLNTTGAKFSTMNVMYTTTTNLGLRCSISPGWDARLSRVALNCIIEQAINQSEVYFLAHLFGRNGHSRDEDDFFCIFSYAVSTMM